MGRFVFGAAALLVLASSPAAAERPWRRGGYTGSPRCAAMLQWASLEPSRTDAQRASLRAVVQVACRPAGAAPPPPPPPPAVSPPPGRILRVRWWARKGAGGRGTGRVAVAASGSAGAAGAADLR